MECMIMGRPMQELAHFLKGSSAFSDWLQKTGVVNVGDVGLGFHVQKAIGRRCRDTV